MSQTACPHKGGRVPGVFSAPAEGLKLLWSDQRKKWVAEPLLNGQWPRYNKMYYRCDACPPCLESGHTISEWVSGQVYLCADCYLPDGTHRIAQPNPAWLACPHPDYGYWGFDGGRNVEFCKRCDMTTYDVVAVDARRAENRAAVGAMSRLSVK